MLFIIFIIFILFQIEIILHPIASECVIFKCILKRYLYIRVDLLGRCVISYVFTIVAIINLNVRNVIIAALTINYFLPSPPVKTKNKMRKYTTVSTNTSPSMASEMFSDYKNIFTG